VWELAFKNFRQATPQNRFYFDFSATAFNNATFLWDSAFITLFGRNGRRAWQFQNKLNNFFAKHHPDGFICREICEADGEDRFNVSTLQELVPKYWPGAFPELLPYGIHTLHQTQRPAVFVFALADR
jgi:hypothetical protein